MELSDLLFNYISQLELSKEEEEEISNFIDQIVKNTEGIYSLLNNAKNDKEQAQSLINLMNKIVKGDI
tara:strand:+ start:301 stop:504 length:204 start_codon:yes stop_codon:yes gene_type:complete